MKVIFGAETFHMLKSSIFLILLLSLLACKKGEDDPFISFRSRDARLIGEWQLVESSSSSNGTYAKVFDGTFMHFYTDGELTDQYTYSLSYLFDKTGAFTSVEISNGSAISGSSNWAWMNNAKRKSGIVLSNGHFYYIKRLSSKELVLYCDVADYDDADTEYTFTETLTFKKK